MTAAIDIRFEGVTPSQALSDDIHEHAQKLLQFAPDLLSCGVTVRRSESRHHQGNRYVVHVRATLPGAEFGAGKTPTPDRSHEDPYVAVRDAFDALRRQLEDHVRIRRGDVKRRSGREGAMPG